MMVAHIQAGKDSISELTHKELIPDQLNEHSYFT